jgi:hypothetical protein
MANLFIKFPSTQQEPPMPETVNTSPSLSVKFDFSHYGIEGNSKTITLPNAQCLKGSFIVVAEASNLIPGRQYTILFELLNPSSTRQVFDPAAITIFASTPTQKFTTVANVDPQYNYILKATINQTDTGIAASDMVAASCASIPAVPTPTPTARPVTASMPRVNFDAGPVMMVNPPNRCREQLNIICTISNARIGTTYKYDFVCLTSDAAPLLSPATGFVTAGFSEQNINTVVTVNPSKGNMVSLQVRVFDAKYPDIILDEDILLIQCYGCE